MRFGTVVFDCDSTLSTIEGIEELAVQHRVEVAVLTEAAMRGEVPLEEVYARRLEIVRPSRDAVRALGERYVATLVPGARETVGTLLEEGVAVRVISGGLRPAVMRVAEALGIPAEHVEAVDLHFASDGSYADFDRESPLARSGGKAEVLAAWRASLPRPVMLVGDGATDLEAAPVVDLFVAFAGVVVHDAVVAGTPVVIRDLSLLPVLPIALGPSTANA